MLHALSGSAKRRQMRDGATMRDRLKCPKTWKTMKVRMEASPVLREISLFNHLCLW